MLLTEWSHNLACSAYAEAEADVTKRQPRIIESLTPIAVPAHANEADTMQL